MPAILSGRFERAQPEYRSRIKAFARQKFRTLPGCDATDLENELLEVLWLSCNTYDPNRGAKFSTYFWTNAQRRFLDLHKAASRQKRVGDYVTYVGLDSESVKAAMSEMLEGSAEEEALALMRVREIYRTGRR